MGKILPSLRQASNGIIFFLYDMVPQIKAIPKFLVTMIPMKDQLFQKMTILPKGCGLLINIEHVNINQNETSICYNRPRAHIPLALSSLPLMYKFV